MIFPKGFFTNGLHCGIKKNREKDLSIFYSQKPCDVAGMFTKNIFKAAPVIVSQKNIKNKICAIVVNSGCANACTGNKGIKDAEKMCQLTANQFDIKSENVLVASTGVIGQYLPMEKIKKGIKKLCPGVYPVSYGVSMSLRPSSLRPSPLSAVKAIMTTDTFPKMVSAICHLPSAICRIWACAKGSGMIEPNMGTMLSFILTDVSITKQALNKALTIAVEKSFNRLTVDGDTSTNDTVFLLANGEAKNNVISHSKPAFVPFSRTMAGRDFQVFCDNLTCVCLELTKMLAKDGEGATKLVIVNVKGARKNNDAEKIAKTVANSPLVKTAVYGNDANWGRIVSAAGRSGVNFNSKKVNVFFGNIPVFKNGNPVNFSEKKVKSIISKKEVTININLNDGKESSTVYTCDFTEGYVKINASYRS